MSLRLTYFILSCCSSVCYNLMRARRKKKCMTFFSLEAHWMVYDLKTSWRTGTHFPIFHLQTVSTRKGSCDQLIKAEGSFCWRDVAVATGDHDVSDTQGSYLYKALFLYHVEFYFYYVCTSIWTWQKREKEWDTKNGGHAHKRAKGGKVVRRGRRACPQTHSFPHNPVLLLLYDLWDNCNTKCGFWLLHYLISKLLGALLLTHKEFNNSDWILNR